MQINKRMVIATAELVHDICRNSHDYYGGEGMVPEWKDVDHWLREEKSDMVEFLLEHPRADLPQMHRFWFAHRILHGWSYGPNNEQAKTLETLVPFDQVPPFYLQAARQYFKTVRLIASFLEEFPPMPVCENPLKDRIA